MASIKYKNEFPWEENGHRCSHNLTCLVLDKGKGNNKIWSLYRIWIKKGHLIRSKTTMIWDYILKLQCD